MFWGTKSNFAAANVASPMDDRSDEDLLLQALDLLIAGKYLSVPEGKDALARKIHELAHTLHGRFQGDAKRTVDISINSSEAVIASADIVGEFDTMSKRAHTIAVATEQMVRAVDDISKSADAAAHEAQSAQHLALLSQQAVDKSVSSMGNIARAVDETSVRVETLTQASSQIGDIVNQIEAIASQTNLLALNATIEAARAGEAGKGFAVVANEVKHLASQTAQATVDIRARIENLRAEMAAIVISMKDAAGAVQDGQAVIDDAGRSMRDVNHQIGAVSNRFGDISAMLGGQASASKAVAQSVTEIADMTNHTIAALGQITTLIVDGTDPVIAAQIAELAKQEIKDVTLHLAKSDHMIWRRKLVQMLLGSAKLNPDELANHHTCRLGKWYDKVEDSALKTHPAFGALEPPHKAVHAHGIEAARLYRQGDLAGATREVGKVAAASKEVLRLLAELAERR